MALAVGFLGGAGAILLPLLNPPEEHRYCSSLADEVGNLASDYEDALKTRYGELLLAGDTTQPSAKHHKQIRGRRAIERLLWQCDASFARRYDELAELGSQLELFAEASTKNQIEQAREALWRADAGPAHALLAKIEEGSRLHSDQAPLAALQRGRIAAFEMNWKDASAHFLRAVQKGLSPEHWREAKDFLLRAGYWDDVTAISRDKLRELRDNRELDPLKAAREMDRIMIDMRVLDRDKEAIVFLRDIRTILHAELGPDHKKSLRNAASLASLLRRNRELEEATAIYRDLLPRLAHAFAPHDRDYVNAVTDYVLILRKNRDTEEGERVLRDLIAGISQNDSEAKSLVKPLSLQGGLFYFLRRYEEAEQSYTRTLTIAVASYPEGSRVVRNLRKHVAASQRAAASVQ
ncbi:MAG: hypothetical protein AAF415_17390 [Pseudomonadota bacterium]